MLQILFCGQRILRLRIFIANIAMYGKLSECYGTVKLDELLRGEGVGKNSPFFSSSQEGSGSRKISCEICFQKYTNKIMSMPFIKVFFLK